MRLESGWTIAVGAYPFVPLTRPRRRSFLWANPQIGRARGTSMTRLKSIPFAIAGLVVLAGTAAAFAALPEASNHGIQTATDASGKSVPVRAAPADAPAVQAPGI